MKMMHRITDNVIYDPSIGKACRDGILPGHFLTEENSDWAIIPTYRGKSYHDMFYGGVKQHPLESGLPQAVAEIFLGQDILSDSGYALVHKRVIALKGENSEFYRANLPYFVKKSSEAWGDYFYAEFFTSILYALRNGCERIAVFRPSKFAKWQLCVLIKASHNAVCEHGGVANLKICDIPFGEFSAHANKNEKSLISPHTPLENSESFDLNPDIKILKFTPSKISRYAQLETSSPRSSPNK